MRLGRRLSTGIAEHPPAPVPAEVTEPVAALDVPAPHHDAAPASPVRTPDPAVSGG